MPLVLAKCTQCGSNLTVEASQDAAVCPFCNTTFITEKAINNYNITNNIKANTVNIFQALDTYFVIRGGILEKCKGCKSLTYIRIPNSVERIETNAFYECSNFKNVQVKDSLLSKSYEGYPIPTPAFRATTFDWKYCDKCQHCGGNFKGLFTKVCEKCKKEKDY